MKILLFAIAVIILFAHTKGLRLGYGAWSELVLLVVGEITRESNSIATHLPHPCARDCVTGGGAHSNHLIRARTVGMIAAKRPC